MADANTVMDMGKDLVDIAKAKKVDAVFIAGANGVLEMKAAASREFILQSAIALVVGLARSTYVEEFGYSMQDAISMVIKELEDRAKVEDS